MSFQPEYRMFLGRYGRTIEYEDASGNFTFVFDSDPDDPDNRRPKGAKEKIIIEDGGVPLKDMKKWKCETQEDREHLALMLERIQQYLMTLGYEAKIV